MSCSDFDWKAYALDEMKAGERRLACEHAAGCAACAEELERLELTRAALMSIHDEEMPRRLAFVSDKVFEPGWWQRIWSSGPRLGFASAAMLSIAILVSAFTRPAPAPAPASNQPDRAQVAALIDEGIKKGVEAELARRMPEVIAKAVANLERRNEEKTRMLLANTERRLELEHKAEMLAVQDNLTILRKQLNQAYVASNRRPAGDEQ